MSARNHRRRQQHSKTVTDPRKPQVIVETLADFYSFNLGNTRSIEIYLPPDYHSATERLYKVLYVNDGQDMPGLRLKETLEKLYAKKRIERIIVVAIYASADRFNEYGTAGIPNARHLGRRASAYTRLLIEEVMPYVERRYRTLTGSANTAIMGWSLGGLAAFDIAWHHADRFGTVGAFSGSFWWRTDNTDPKSQQSSRIAHRVVRASQKRPELRLWFEAGTADEIADRDQDGRIDAIQDTLELIDGLESVGYRRGAELAYVEMKGGRHDQATWAKALPIFLRWAFPTSRWSILLAKIAAKLRLKLRK